MEDRKKRGEQQGMKGLETIIKERQPRNSASTPSKKFIAAGKVTTREKGRKRGEQNRVKGFNAIIKERQQKKSLLTPSS